MLIYCNPDCILQTFFQQDDLLLRLFDNWQDFLWDAGIEKEAAAKQDDYYQYSNYTTQAPILPKIAEKTDESDEDIDADQSAQR